MRPLNLDSFEGLARGRLPRFLFDYIAGGAEDEWSLADARSAFTRRPLVPRILADVADRGPGVTLLGESYSLPFGIAPMGGGSLFGRGVDRALMVAAREAGIPMILSGASFTPVEMAGEFTDWFQMMMPASASEGEALAHRFAAAGGRTLVVVVDVPAAGRRERDLRNGFGMPPRLGGRMLWQALLRPRWSWTIGRHLVGKIDPLPNVSPASGGFLPAMAGLGFEHLRSVRRAWAGTLIVKGILSPLDAKLAIDAGADAVIVSNHGARQLDGVVSPFDALEPIVRAIPDVPVLLDGGIRRGSDIVKAFAAGASFVFVGRPMLYAAAWSGIEGVRNAIRLLGDEVDRAMAMCGLSRLGDANSEYLFSSRPTHDSQLSSGRYR